MLAICGLTRAQSVVCTYYIPGDGCDELDVVIRQSTITDSSNGYVGFIMITPAISRDHVLRVSMRLPVSRCTDNLCTAKKMTLRRTKVKFQGVLEFLRD